MACERRNWTPTVTSQGTQNRGIQRADLPKRKKGIFSSEYKGAHVQLQSHSGFKVSEKCSVSETVRWENAEGLTGGREEGGEVRGRRREEIEGGREWE